MCEVTIVIPNYKGKEYLLHCVRSLHENDDTDKKILIVDNASADGSVEEVQKFYPDVEFIMLDKNCGFCKAVNIGIEKTETPYVILLNNDTIIKKDFVFHLLHAIKKDPNLFSVEPKMIQYHDQTKIDSAGTYYNALGWAYAYGKDKDKELYNSCRKIFAACGGASIYKRSVFEKIGMFDEKHFAYLEDVDIGYRARIKGFTNAYEPKAQVIHVGSAASGARYNGFKIRLSSRNNVYLIYKNMPVLQIVINLPFLLMGFLIKYIFFLKKGFGKIYLKGLKEGILMCERKDKVHYVKGTLKNYIKIQIELWVNVLKRFW